MSNEAFEKWFVVSKYNDEYYQIAKEAWQAAKVDSEQEIAKLIVKECIWQLECAKQGDSFTGETYDNEVNDALTSQIDNLKEHFGV